MILEWLDRAANDRPDHPCIVERDAVTTFAQLAERTRWRYEDRRGSPTPHRIVGLGMTSTSETFVALLELWMAGYVAQLEPAGTPPNNKDEIAEPGDALIVMTSGSSGGPKAVRLTFDNLAASAAASARHLDHSPDERWLCNLPLHHIGGFSIFLRSLREATTMILEPDFDPVRTARLLAGGEATIASLVPTTLQRTLEASTEASWACRSVLVGGGPLPQPLLVRALEAGLPAMASYGMTETASQAATAIDPGGPLVPLPGVDLRTSADGAIEVAGPMVSPGYLGEPPRGEPWFRTGDIGRLDDGNLVVVGRTDHVIITGGENVHPETVEAVLESLPGIDSACVIGLPDADWGQRVVAVYQGAVASAEELRSSAAQVLARHEVPARWIRVERLPRTGIGKIDRVAVHQLVDAQ